MTDCTHPPRDRPRRHEDRDRRARRRRPRDRCAAGSPTPRDDYAATIATVAGLVEGAERELGVARHASASARRARCRARPGLLRGSNSVWLNGRADPGGPRGGARPRGAPHQRRQLLRAVGGERRRGAGRRRRVRRDPRHRRGRRHRRPRPRARRANAIAGEWGHNPLPWPRDDERPGPACFCGRAGCIETWLSGPGMARDHRHATGDAVAPPRSSRAAAGGDGACAATLVRYEERLARALAHVINIVDPDVIVLGGGMSNVDAALRARAAALGRRGCSPTASTRGSSATSTAIRRACAARPGSGSVERPRVGVACGTVTNSRAIDAVAARPDPAPPSVPQSGLPAPGAGCSLATAIGAPWHRRRPPYPSRALPVPGAGCSRARAAQTPCAYVRRMHRASEGPGTRAVSPDCVPPLQARIGARCSPTGVRRAETGPNPGRSVRRVGAAELVRAPRWGRRDRPYAAAPATSPGSSARRRLRA